MAVFKKKVTSLIIMLVLVVTFIAPGFSQGVSESNKKYTMAGFDGGSLTVNWESNLFFSRMEEKTGISFSFDQSNEAADWAKKKQAYFSGAEALPDVLFKASLTLEEEEIGYEKGMLIDLKPFLAEHAPNLYRLLQENPEWEKAISLPNGAIVSLPYIDLLRTQNAMWINATWLSNLNLKAPTTKSELEEVLRAFKDNDPNQNGKKDEIPYTFVGSWDLKFLSHAFGEIANDYNIYITNEGQVAFLPNTTAYYNLLLWLKDLYRQGLLDNQGFSQSDQLRSLAKDSEPATYGFIMGPTAYTTLPEGHAKQYEMLLPLKDDDGKQVYRDFVGPVMRGTFAITSSCENPQELLAWADYLYSEEGAILAMAGVEGKEYTLSEEGKWQTIQTEGSMNVQSGTIVSGNLFPWYSPVEFELSIDSPEAFKTFQSAKKLGEIAKLPFPYYTLTVQEKEYIMPLQKEIATYVDESLARFVTGEWELDQESWQKYIQEFETLNLNDFISFWQNIYEVWQ